MKKTRFPKFICAVFCLCSLLCCSPAVAAQTGVLSSDLAPSSDAAVGSTVSGAALAESDGARGNIFEASISELSDMLQKGQITSEMLCEVYLERIDTFDKDDARLNSVLSINKNALEQARILDSERRMGTLRGPLHGIVLLVQDSIDVAGFPTTVGRRSLAPEVRQENAAAVQKLVDAGAIILGKTNLSTDDLVTRYTVSALLGETRNAYDTAYSAGGCAGGSAVAVSANFAAAALAVDTNASATYPAALNGVVALRPTYGLVDFSGCFNVVRARDTVVPVTRSVADAALLLEILTDKTEDFSGALKVDALQGKKIAVLRELSEYTYNSPNEFKSADAEVTALFQAALEDLKRLGADVVSLSIPKLFTYVSGCRESLAGAQQQKAALLEQLNTELQKSGADVLVFPSYLSAPLPSGFDGKTHRAETGLLLNCGAYLPSLIGLPAVTVPMGSVHGKIPAGLEFVGLPGADAQLLALCYAYEQGTARRTVSDLAPNLHPVLDLSASQDNSRLPDSETPPPARSSGFQVIIVVIFIVAALGFCVWLLLLSRPHFRGRRL